MASCFILIAFKILHSIFVLSHINLFDFNFLLSFLDLTLNLLYLILFLEKSCGDPLVDSIQEGIQLLVLRVNLTDLLDGMQVLQWWQLAFTQFRI